MQTELSELTRLAKAAKLTLKEKDGRMRINYRGGREGTAFYADTFGEAVSAIEQMAQFKERRL
jgi:hypothetical protein